MAEKKDSGKREKSLRHISPEQQTAISRMGGKACQAARARKRELRLIASAMLDGQVLETDEIYEELTSRGFENCYANAMMLSVMMKAMHGDVDAARFIRDTAGQKPSDQVQIGNIDGVPFMRREMANLSDDALRQMIEEAEYDEEKENGG